MQTAPTRSFTSKGERTRSKIVDTAASLMLLDGVAGTTIEGVCETAGVGKSQIYHYFDDKNELVRAVIELQAELVLNGQEPHLTNIRGWESWDAWRDFVVDIQRKSGCAGGCPLGSLASELTDGDDLTRMVLVRSFQRWERAFLEGVQQMKDLGLVRQDTDAALLATTLLAALQGGLLLCQTCKDVSPLETSLAGAIAYLRTFAESE
ncbi:TetR/AcrR family transcriptional regulator [Diaminobutyricibacter tongyongensis]|uniref:TetR/AcrR family transcriptional regulator n=1 Tax=Leifsonia tongyongensis TaxID=1268043 RepID=A0A6L9Y2H6_9MICO|nr:TetR/AcrR family transcriptional regulator [Diaminobutyricibacter tongyongensis]NEN07776.1 TetR/AcrR family transcriptional regulator [Diaminobutyricibacter tongyongensis]